MEEPPLGREIDQEEKEAWEELERWNEEHRIEVPDGPDFRPLVSND